MGWKDIPAALREGWPAEPTTDAKNWHDLLGPHVSEDVKRLSSVTNGGYLLSDPKNLLDASNSFEKVIDWAREKRALSPIIQAFTSTWFLANLPQVNDCLMFHCSHERDTAEVLVWSYEEGLFLDPPVAFDLPTALRFLEVVEEKGEAEARAERLAPTLGRYADLWPFNTLEQELAAAGVLQLAQQKRDPQSDFKPGSSAFSVLQDRAWWIAELLFGAPLDESSLQYQLDWVPDVAMTKPFFSTYAPSALYWLWRSYLVDEPWLDEILSLLRQSPARLVRDATKIVDDLQSGKRHELSGVDLMAARESVLSAIRFLSAEIAPTEEVLFTDLSHDED